MVPNYVTYEAPPEPKCACNAIHLLWVYCNSHTIILYRNALLCDSNDKQSANLFWRITSSFCFFVSYIGEEDGRDFD